MLAFALGGGLQSGRMSYPSISSRVADVRDRIAAACARAGRNPADVTIIAVTKTHPESAVTAVREAGILDVGENRVQEMDAKVGVVGKLDLRWHLIGHLQTNKVKRAIELADVIHSLDSVRLAERVSLEAMDKGVTVEALVQVNVAEEDSKGGIAPASALDDIAEICSLPGLRITGLMSIAPFVDDERVLRSTFSATRDLRDAAASLPGFNPLHLSMGMSGDFEIAIEEGSTLVRLGTVLLGERTP